MWSIFKRLTLRGRLRAGPVLRQLMIAGAASVLATGANAQSTSPESADAVNAAFLFNFAKFTTWPSVNDLDSSVKFCIQSNTIDPAVFSGWGKKRVQNRPVRVVFFERTDVKEVATCSVMFIRQMPEGDSIPALAARASQSNTLLVSDTPNFGVACGHIELFISNRRLRFKVNLASLSDARLSLGAGVPNLAEIVGTEGARK